MPTESDFLREIAARPDDAVLRLAYADWLDEHPNPVGGVRAELVRIEEEMWGLPVFADRYWDLKPRRNELRRGPRPASSRRSTANPRPRDDVSPSSTSDARPSPLEPN